MDGGSECWKDSPPGLCRQFIKAQSKGWVCLEREMQMLAGLQVNTGRLPGGKEKLARLLLSVLKTRAPHLDRTLESLWCLDPAPQNQT